MNGSDIGEVVVLGIVGAVGLWIFTRVSPYISPLLWDVELGESGVMMVTGRVIRHRVIPYEHITSIREMTRLQAFAEAWRRGGPMSGVVNRGSPVVVIARDDRAGLFICSPRDRRGFMTDLEQRVAHARHRVPHEGHSTDTHAGLP